ncbi:hypothetical protein KAF25_011178 [Fusarium avenaceum]|uniref:Integral membrane protein n=1 Tax=Fusarium avenaceum TaxID=40199 RepID=A0A9P7GUC8_9HYPO|nr:hypothetical protein KAF25_011178 [Fusarium avenaceum]
MNAPQYGQQQPQPHSPPWQAQQQYPPPPSPYRPVSAQPEPIPSQPQSGPRSAPVNPEAQYNADFTNAKAALQAHQAQAEQEAAQARVNLEALTVQSEIQLAQARAEMQATAEKEQANLRAQLQSQRSQAQAHTQQLETQWREAEKLAAQYKADYEAQMRQAEADLARMRIEEQSQVDQMEKLRAEEARNHQLAEEEVVKEQQRLLDEIQRQREQQQQQQQQQGMEEQRPPLPPRISTQREEAAPPLPTRPVSTAGTTSPGSRPVSYYPPPPAQRNSYLSPQSQATSSPSQGYIPPPPPGPPPAQSTSPSHNPSGGYVSPAPVSPGQASQQMPYHTPSVSSPQTQGYPSRDQINAQRPADITASPLTAQYPSQRQPETSYYPPPPVQSPPQQQPPSSIPSHTQPAKPPRVRTPGPAEQHACGAKVGLECSAALTAFPQHWFYHAAVPEFVLCARCYVESIYETNFRDSFRKVFYDDGERRRCRFNIRRVKESLLPAAIESGSLDQLIEFMKKRMTIKDCREQNLTEGEMWYRANDIPHGTICEACFEDGIIISSFAKYYSLQPSQGGAYCDLSVWFLKRKFMDYAKENRWAEFCQEFNQRAQLPECPKMNTASANSRAWYKPNYGPEGLQACVACYHDYFYASEDQGKWQQVTGGDFETRCSLGQLNHAIPMQQALDDEDRSLFWNAAREMHKYPFCDKEGTKGSVWYVTLNDDRWGICAACYEGIVKPIGGSRWFVKDTSTTPDGVYLCGFNLGHPRAPKALETYVNARNWGESKLLLDWAAQWGHVEPCQGIKFRKNKPWWGWGLCAICEECYLSFAKGTALEPRFALTGPGGPDKARMCDLFSRRMRGLYTEACRTGDLEGFLTLAEQRHTVYSQTIMQCDQILSQQRLAAMRSQYLGMQGSFYKNLGRTHDLTVGHNYTVGNSYVGYGHANEWIAEGYAYDRQSREVAAQAMGGGPVMRIQMLEARWKEVE